MSSSSPATRSSRRNRFRHVGRTLFLSVVCLALAAITFCGPKLFAQSGAVANHTAPVIQGSGTSVAPGVPVPVAATPIQHTSGGEGVMLPFGDAAVIPLYIVLAAAILALAFGFYWWRKTLAQSPGSERMQGVSAAVQEGALAYLGRQVRTMIPLVVVIGIGLFFLYHGQYSDQGQQKALLLGAGVSLAFILGVTASYLAGYVGMGVAVRANCRVANAALSSFKNALETAFQAGAVSGMFTVGLGLLGATITFMIFKENAMFVLVGFGFGGNRVGEREALEG